MSVSAPWFVNQEKESAMRTQKKASLEATRSFVSGLLMLGGAGVLAIAVFIAGGRQQAAVAPPASMPSAPLVAREPLASQPPAPRAAPIPPLAAKPQTAEVAPSPVAPPPKAAVEAPAPQDTYAEVDELIESKNVDGAIVKLRELATKDPDDDSALARLGLVYLLDKDDKTSAEPMLKRALEANPQNEDAAWGLVEIGMHDPERTTETLSFLKSMQAREPESENLTTAVGDLYALTDRPAEALPYFQKLAETADDKAFALSKLGKAQLALGATENAIDTLQQALDAHRQHVETDRQQGAPKEHTDEHLLAGNCQLARAMIAARRFDEAEELLRQSVEIRPGDEIVDSLMAELQAARNT
jgi:tetratricopeptide (TPR) repeat protein